MKHTLALVFCAAVLSACSSTPRTPTYECPLHSVERAKCASVKESLEASRRMAGSGGTASVQSVFDPRAAAGAQDDAQPVVGQLSGYPAPTTTGAPVFQQPKVMRVWIAPYVDADGNLRSGEYAYFSTPGSWNYGTLKKPGAASGIMGPAKPSDLGFTPVLPASRTTTGTPQRPPEPSDNASGSPSPQGQPRPQATTTSQGITQPYQRLNQ